MLISDIARKTPSETSAMSASAAVRLGLTLDGNTRGSRFVRKIPAARHGRNSGILTPMLSSAWWLRIPMIPATWMARIARRKEK